MWVNVLGEMHTLDDTQLTKCDANDLPGFLFPSQVASLKLVETEDLIPVIAPIVWPKFGPFMTVRYPSQPLRVEASTLTLSILHFLDPEEISTHTSLRALVRTIANLRPPKA